MNAKHSNNQVGTSCCLSHSMRAGVSAPGGAEPVLSSGKTSAASATTLRSARGRSLGVLALAADALRGVSPSSAPPGAKAPAFLKWDMQQHVPTWLIKGFAFGALRPGSLPGMSPLLTKWILRKGGDQR